jgi:glycyl-tRNA synthetase
MFLAILSNSLIEEMLENNTTRTVLKIPAFLCPYKVAILPLIKKDGLPQIAKDIYNTLKLEFNVTYDEKDAVGRRYRRQDAIGTPFCVTIDHQTKEDNTITIRERDSMIQNRIPLNEVENYIKVKVSSNSVLSKIF